jgi:hypothetical protein
MLHTYVQRFDVTGNMQNILGLLGSKHGLMKSSLPIPPYQTHSVISKTEVWHSFEIPLNFLHSKQGLRN